MSEDTLIREIKKLKKTRVRKLVEKKLKQFAGFRKKGKREWFSELCFCILTANSKAHTAIKIQNELGAEGFCSTDREGVRKCIIAHRHRFHNNKTEYIMGAREHIDIKSVLFGMKSSDAREWLVRNVKGLGYKEASHFLRNVGYFDLAILDRHIINLMAENRIIKKPKSLTKKRYLGIEKKFKKLAAKLKMSPAELDLYMWYMKTGEVLK